MMKLLFPILALATGTLALSLPSKDQWKDADVDLKPRASCENTPTSRSCWGDYSIDTNYYDEVPVTGVTREYWLTVDRVDCAPDGYTRSCLAFNGTIPGPTLFADWGDQMIVHVTNNVPDNGTTIHWHGVRQLNTVGQDGVPGVTQCPIAPNEELTYSFQVTQYGSTWYHSHFSLQYAEGLFGGLILNGPATADYDEDLGMLFLNDWGHNSAFDVWYTARQGGPPSLQNGLVNGTNTYDCDALSDTTCTGLLGSKYETVFEPGKKYRVRLVNAATDGHFQFSVDGHALTVIAADLVPIVPYAADSVLVAMGQRVDVIIQALDSGSGDYWLRAGWTSACSTNYNADDITGIVRYDAGSTADPATESSVTPSTTCGDEPYESIVPYLALDVGDITSVADEAVDFAFGSYFTWTINGTSLMLDWSNPTVQQVMAGDSIFPTDYNVVAVNGGATKAVNTANANVKATAASNSTSTSTSASTSPSDISSSDSAEWALLIIEDASGIGITHPIHLHGHDFWVLAQDTGVYDSSSVVLNKANPPRRDVASLPGNGYLAIAFKLDNPGTWLVHCHIAWHASEGLSLEFVESENLISTVSVLESEASVLTDTCSAWGTYTGTSLFGGQDDSGI